MENVKILFKRWKMLLKVLVYIKYKPSKRFENAIKVYVSV